MQTNIDNQVRIVALANLKAMCKRISGVCHEYSIIKVTPNRVHIEYSNPDEWGNPSPIIATYPSYRNVFEQTKDNPIVVIDIVDIFHDSHNGEAWQCFEVIRDCPQLWNNNGQWQTREEIEKNN